jgi:TAT (twin-arginine translocation) pathway-exported protein
MGGGIRGCEEVIMSDDPDFSRRDFLRGLGAAAAASAAPKEAIEAATHAVGQPLHPLATELATNVWQLHEPYYARYPNDFQDLRAEVIQYLTGFNEDLGRDPETFGEKIRAYRDAARLLESGWTPPARASTVEREAEGAPPSSEDRTLSGMPRGTIKTVTLAEHVDELRAEVRGSLDSRERNTIATELDVARAALKDHVISDALRLEVMPNQLGAGDAKMRRDDVDSAVARLSAEMGLPHTPAAGGEFVTGIIPICLATGPDVSRAARKFNHLWPCHTRIVAAYFGS